MEETLSKLKEAIVVGKEDEARQLAEKVLQNGVDPITIVNNMADAMAIVGKKYEDKEYFIPEVLVSAKAFEEAMTVVKPELEKATSKMAEMGPPRKIILGVVEGDIHDLGKKILATMLNAAGFKVIDLGRDVPLESFIKKAEEENADIIAMSSLMTTTMTGMEAVINTLKERNLRSKYKVIVGGGPITQAFAERIGADAYGKDSTEGVRKCKEL